MSRERNATPDVRDLLELGLVDATWCDRLPPLLAERLRRLLESPES